MPTATAVPGASGTSGKTASTGGPPSVSRARGPGMQDTIAPNVPRPYTARATRWCSGAGSTPNTRWTSWAAAGRPLPVSSAIRPASTAGAGRTPGATGTSTRIVPVRLPSVGPPAWRVVSGIDTRSSPDRPVTEPSAPESSDSSRSGTPARCRRAAARTWASGSSSVPNSCPAPVGSAIRPRPRTVSAARPPIPATVRSGPGAGATGPSSPCASNRGRNIASAPVTSPTPSAQTWWASRIAAPRPSGSSAPTIRHSGRSRGSGIAASRPTSSSRVSPPSPRLRASTTCQDQSSSSTRCQRQACSTDRRVSRWS